MQFQKSKGVKQNWALMIWMRFSELAGAKTDLLTKDKRKDVTNYIQRTDYTTRQLKQGGRSQARTLRQEKTSHTWKRSE